MIRTVGDNSFLVSALLWSGPSKRVLTAAAEGAFDLLVSEDLLTELRSALSGRRLESRIKGDTNAIESLIARVRALATVVESAAISAPELRDQNDLPVLAAAVGGHADLIVTGDNDLLVLGEFEGIGIVKAVELLRTLGLD